MKKILIVEDQPEVRELVEITLSSDAYLILTAENGMKGVEIAARENPDVILMDIMMPGNIDGLEATRIIKNDPRTSSSYIVLLTAKGQKSDIEKGYEAGADDYFIKPFSPLELIGKVEEILKK